jgi:hypothetical protein
MPITTSNSINEKPRAELPPFRHIDLCRAFFILTTSIRARNTNRPERCQLLGCMRRAIVSFASSLEARGLQGEGSEGSVSFWVLCLRTGQCGHEIRIVQPLDRGGARRKAGNFPNEIIAEGQRGESTRDGSYLCLPVPVPGGARRNTPREKFDSAKPLCADPLRGAAIFPTRDSSGGCGAGT